MAKRKITTFISERQYQYLIDEGKRVGEAYAVVLRDAIEKRIAATAPPVQTADPKKKPRS